VSGELFTVLSTFTGAELVGKKYTPLFPYFLDEYGPRAFRVVSDAYVTDDAGTGVVHQVRACGRRGWLCRRICEASGALPACPRRHTQ
jgi:isoleucyl-tRNA synthetase